MPTDNAIYTNASGVGGTKYLSRALSADGRYVFFSTIEPLLPRDTNGRIDAYEYDTQTAQLHLLSSGTSPQDSWFVEADQSGHNAFIVTRQALAGSDTDTSYDLYDVRLGGGFPAPPPPHVICQSETCQGSLTAPPAAAPLSSGVEGPPNPRSPRCPKGKHLVRAKGKARCVKTKKHHKRHRRVDARMGGSE
jgi:hypothetical protein